MSQDSNNSRRPLQEQIDSIVGQLDTNTAVTNEIKKDTSEIIEWFNHVQGAFKVLQLVGKLAVPLTAIVAFFTAVLSWQSIKQAVISGIHHLGGK